LPAAAGAHRHQPADLQHRINKPVAFHLRATTFAGAHPDPVVAAIKFRYAQPIGAGGIGALASAAGCAPISRTSSRAINQAAAAEKL